MGGGAGSGNGPPNPQQLNRYSYVLNNPIKHTDPTGHCIWDLCLIETATVVAVIVEVVIPAVVGTAIIAGASVIGDELGRVHAAVSEGDDSSPALEEEVERYQGELKAQRNKAGGATVVLDEQTGKVYRGLSGEEVPPESLHPDIRGQIPETSLRADGIPATCCSEVKAVDAALKDGAQLGNLVEHTFRPSKGRPLPRCPNCEHSVRGVRSTSDERFRGSR